MWGGGTAQGYAFTELHISGRSAKTSDGLPPALANIAPASDRVGLCSGRLKPAHCLAWMSQRLSWRGIAHLDVQRAVGRNILAGERDVLTVHDLRAGAGDTVPQRLRKQLGLVIHARQPDVDPRRSYCPLTPRPQRAEVQHRPAVARYSHGAVRDEVQPERAGLVRRCWEVPSDVVALRAIGRRRGQYLKRVVRL